MAKNQRYLPELKKGKINQKVDEEKLLELAEKVREILIREGRIKEQNEGFSFRRGACSC